MTGSLPRTVVAAGAIGFAVVPVAGIDTTPTWETPEPVANVPNYFLDIDEYEGQPRYLAFDHHGLPGIAFADQANVLVGVISYARRAPGLGWFADPVAQAGFQADFVTQPCLAYDFSETPSISVMSIPNDTGIPTAYFGRPDEDDSWTMQELDIFELGGDPKWLASSLAYDVLGRAHVLFVRRSFFGDPKIAFVADANANGDLTDDQLFFVFDLDPGPNEVESLSLAVDQLARPMCAIGLVDNSSPNPKQLYFGIKDIGQGWGTVQLDLDARHPSLAIDPDTGYPAIAYHDSANQNLVYTEWDGDQWMATNIDTTGSTGWWPSLAFDPADGNPAIAYQSQTEGDLMFAWHDGVQWNTQVAVNGTVEVPTGYTPSLAFNDFGTGFPAIAYFGIDSNLYFVEDPPKLGDFDGDAHVGVLDFLFLLANWGQADSPADLDGNGTVGLEDFLMLLENWG
jgi:hypothetical protein